MSNMGFGADYQSGQRGSFIKTASFAPSAPPQMAGGQPVPAEATVEQIDSAEIARSYKNSPAEVRKATSRLLRDAGWRVPVTSKYNILVRDALIEAYTEFDLEVRNLSATDPYAFKDREYNLTKYLKDRPVRGESDGGPQTIRYQQDPTDEALARGINQVYEDLIGRGASKEEREKYAKKIRKELAKVENMATTTITDLGGGVQQRTDRGGFDTEAFLYQQLGGNDEVKTRQIFNFYDAFKRAIGVQ
jgi:hypothetical protein